MEELPSENSTDDRVDTPGISQMKSSPESISENLDKLLKRTSPDQYSELSDSEKSRLNHDKSLFFEQVTRTTLDWMSTGMTKQIDGLNAEIAKTLEENMKKNLKLTPISLFEQVVISISEVGKLLSTFRRTNNMSKLLGIVSSKRRRAWRELLLHMLEINHPIDAKEALENNPLFNSLPTAQNALGRLTDEGLLAREKSAGRFLYSLTYDGRAVAKTLEKSDLDAEAESQEERIVSEPLVCKIVNFPNSKSCLLNAKNYSCHSEDKQTSSRELVFMSTDS